MNVLVINGPNINMLGIREPDIYGTGTYAELVDLIETYCMNQNIEVEIYQSNHEGYIIDKIQDAYGKADCLIINPGAYTHTSVAIADAIKATGIRTAEVHISDIEKREEFRKISYVKDVCEKRYIGLGFEGYIKAIKEMKG